MNTQTRVASEFDTRTLSTQQRRAMRICRTWKLFRHRGRWGNVPNSVSLDVGSSLVGLKIFAVDRSGRFPELVLTGYGQTILAVLDQRAARRTRP